MRFLSIYSISNFNFQCSAALTFWVIVTHLAMPSLYIPKAQSAFWGKKLGNSETYHVQS